MVEFTPQPFAILKARFAEAMKKSYSVVEAKNHPETRPGNKPQQVFDFEDGIRLIISREMINEVEVVHFSGSIDARYYKEPENMKATNIMVQHFIELSGSRYGIKFAGFSNGNIPHWYVQLNGINLN